MNTILNQYADKINGTFSFFDRIIIKGHIRQFFSPSGKSHFLSYNNTLLNFEVSRATNFEYLEALKGIIPKKSVEAEINAVCRK